MLTYFSFFLVHTSIYDDFFATISYYGSAITNAMIVVGGGFQGLFNIDVLHRFMENPHLTLAFNRSISKTTHATKCSDIQISDIQM